MNRKIIFLTLTFMSILFLGCKNTPEGKYVAQSDNLDLLPDSVKQHLETQDSLFKELVSQVDMLTNELNSANTEIRELRSTMEEKKRQGMLWTILPIAIGGITLLAFIIDLCTRRYVKKDNFENDINCYLRNHDWLKIKDWYEKFHGNIPHQLPNSSPMDGKILNLDSRLVDLETTIAEMKRKATVENDMQRPVHLNSSVSVEKSPSFSAKRLYAKSISKSYLTEIVETKEETCAFVIELKDETHGKFDIASFNQMKQLNGLEMFIDYSGNCKIVEANAYTLNDKGICEKQSGIWKVVEKLKITISK